MDKTSASGRLSSWIFPLLATLLMVINVCLVIQNINLRAELSTPEAMLPRKGAHIAEIDGSSVDGAPMRVRFGADQKPTVLLVFSTTCGVCRMNWPNWEKLSGLMKDGGSRIEYININSNLSQNYLDMHGIPGAEAFAQLDQRSRTQLNLQVTPLTILVRADGTIDRYWAGRLEPEVVTEIPGIVSKL